MEKMARTKPRIGWATFSANDSFAEALFLEESDKRPPITAYDFRFASDSFAACALTCNAF